MQFTALRCLRSMLLVALFALSVATPLSTSRVDAQTMRSGHEIDYYSDATFTHQVGFVVFCLNGQTIRSGQMTQFSKIITENFC